MSQATFYIFKDVADEFRWNLKHDNGNVIACSCEGFTSKQNAINSIASVKANAPDAPVVDQTQAERAR